MMKFGLMEEMMSDAMEAADDNVDIGNEDEVDILIN